MTTLPQVHARVCTWSVSARARARTGRPRARVAAWRGRCSASWPWPRRGAPWTRAGAPWCATSRPRRQRHRHAAAARSSTPPAACLPPEQAKHSFKTCFITAILDFDVYIHAMSQGHYERTWIGEEWYTLHLFLLVRKHNLSGEREHRLRIKICKSHKAMFLMGFALHVAYYYITMRHHKYG